jgi:hypothetical protein
MYDDDKSRVIEGNTNYKGGDLVIPKYVGDTKYSVYKVVGLTAYCFKDAQLTGVTIPDGIKSIGRVAFYNCPTLSSIKIDSNSPIECFDSTFSDMNTTYRGTLLFTGG